MKNTPLSHLDAYDAETNDVNVIIETPQGSRSKFSYDEEHGLFKLKKVMPLGSVFPFDFGFVPSTLGQDGDPLDVLILLDAPLFQGNLAAARLLGVIEAEQTERGGETMRNDRLIAVAACSQDHKNLQKLDDLEQTIVTEIEQFFVTYNMQAGKQFKPLGRGNPDQARKLIEEGIQRFKKQAKEASK